MGIYLHRVRNGQVHPQKNCRGVFSSDKPRGYINNQHHLELLPNVHRSAAKAFTSRVTFLVARDRHECLSYILSTPARVTFAVALVYFLSSFFSASIREISPQPGDSVLRYRKNAWVTMSLPRILRGDEMYYLMMAHSLAEDGDLYLSREYTSVHLGGPEMGVYHRGRPAQNIFQHFTRDANFTLLARHPLGLPALLAALLWPLGGSIYMEPAAIWITALWGAMGVLVFIRVLEALGVSWPRARAAALALAFATPWWSYSRTLYTEVYIGTAYLIVMLAVLRNRTLLSLPFLMAMGWFKYPALLLFFGAGIGDAIWKRWWRFIIIGTTGAATALGIYWFLQRYFADASWASLTAQQIQDGYRAKAGVKAPVIWIGGETLSNIRRLFLDFDKGLFPHCPLLLVALAGVGLVARRARRPFLLILICAVPWVLVHITYEYLMSGASYTTRYLVPLIPLVLLGLPWFWEWSEHRRLWRMGGIILVVFSAVNNGIAGIFPALSFDSDPMEMLRDLVHIVVAMLSF